MRLLVTYSTRDYQTKLGAIWFEHNYCEMFRSNHKPLAMAHNHTAYLDHDITARSVLPVRELN
ncbi:hypothetical protein pVco7_gp051 [Vibrio phage pVco-7]|uniref:Uncharacterized protein n=1 Tax=Vibrio phage pVco-5 TaxID=1965485 RepID=A0A1W6JUV7_9CAUD|nr:hypothetical protein KNT61_gp052 [Vibrio phage pVco-5]ARM71040.1 hypothetical protein pVco5_052 [Vibrio phage pVco-5]